MTVESTYAITTLSDWPKHLSSVFQPVRGKNQSYLVRAVFPALWFIALQYPVVIGRINYFWYWFFDSLLKTALRATQTLYNREHPRAPLQP